MGHRVQLDLHIIISLCCWSSGLCKIHKVLSPALGITVSCRRRELLLGMVSHAEQPGSAFVVLGKWLCFPLA